MGVRIFDVVPPLPSVTQYRCRLPVPCSLKTVRDKRASKMHEHARDSKNMRPERSVTLEYRALVSFLPARLSLMEIRDFLQSTLSDTNKDGGSLQRRSISIIQRTEKLKTV